MVTVADLIAYRRRHDKLVERVVATALPTAFGDFSAVGYRSLVDNKHHVALVKGDVAGKEDVLVRVHSECLTGDVFHSLRCDCGEQLEHALAMIEREGQGVLLYLSQEGRGHRPAQQAARLQAPGGGLRHRRGQPQARAARRPARLRHRRADPARPRPRADPDPHEQPEEDRRPGRLRPRRLRPDPDPVRAQPAQRGATCAPRRRSSGTSSTTRACRSTRRCSRARATRRPGTPDEVRPGRGPLLRGAGRAAGARAPAARSRATRSRSFDVPGAFELPLTAKLCAESGPLRRRRLPRRGDPRRDRPLRLRLRRGGPRDPGRPARHRRALRVRRAHRSTPWSRRWPGPGEGKRDTGAHAAEAVLAQLRVRDALRSG